MPTSTPLPPLGKTAETNGKKPQIWVISDGTAGMRLQAIALGEALIATDITNQTSLADIVSQTILVASAFAAACSFPAKGIVITMAWVNWGSAKQGQTGNYHHLRSAHGGNVDCA